MNYTPVIIIGAGRSGTNMLRDIITSIPSFETWDCDEINPIWRYGNQNFPTDELKPENASPKIINYITGRFHKIHRQTGAEFIVEKTCANSLRLAYIYRIFPNAKYIIINRDGRDVVTSAMKRWTSSFDFKYTVKKLRYVPLIDLPFYISKFGFNRIKRIFSKTESLSFWGPVYRGLEEQVKKDSLMEVCAKQWQECTESTLRDIHLIPEQNCFNINYEVFVKNPISEMTRLISFFKIDLSEDDKKELTKNVSSKSVGTYKKTFSNQETKTIINIIAPTLKKLGYE